MKPEQNIDTTAGQAVNVDAVVVPFSPSGHGIVQSLPYKFVDFDFFKYPSDGEWDSCPFCGQKPPVWEFDNGRNTACGCLLKGFNPYTHFSIHAESIMSVHKRHKGNVSEYDYDGLRKNWNHWCKTGEIVFNHASSLRADGRW